MGSIEYMLGIAGGLIVIVVMVFGVLFRPFYQSELPLRVAADKEHGKEAGLDTFSF